MIRLSNLSLPLNYTDNIISNFACRELKIENRSIKGITLHKLSIDARKKGDIKFVAAIDVDVDISENKVLSYAKNLNAQIVTPYKYELNKVKLPEQNPIVVGSGPAGLFAGLVLAKAGAKPIIIERGKDVDSRISDVKMFWQSKKFNPDSNVQFGEGGAGTFSDGKLTTGTKDERQRFVLEEFTENGAPKDILYNAKPHIGTDYLREVVKNLRKKIISLGGQVLFETKLIDIKFSKNQVSSAVVEQKGVAKKIQTKHIVLAIGHSARDSFEMLLYKQIPIEAKPFSVGVRIEHLRKEIDKSQHEKFAGHKNLGAAAYKLSAKTKSGRGVYSFCMCPGGKVIAAQSDENTIVTNGMSNYARDAENSNSGILVSVGPEDFGSSHPLSGMHFQQKLERNAFAVTNDYIAPVQRLEDFMKKQTSRSFGSVTPSYLPGVAPSDLHKCLPDYITDAIKLAIPEFNRKVRNFAHPDAILTGTETRSSSPIKILRNKETLESIKYKGLFPCGEGAGYAGGIISAAVDGIKCAESILASR